MSHLKRESFRIMSFGEILWDLLPGGRKVGGAPANFAYHCRQLGGDVRLLSRVGDDPLGKEILEYCAALDLSTELIETDDSAPTGTVDVRLGPDGQPKYTINEHVAWDSIEATDAAICRVSESDVIAFGSLAARSASNRRTLRTLIETIPSRAIRVLDLNLRDPFCDRENVEFVLAQANVLKLNDEELERIAVLFGLSGRSVEERLRELRERFRFRLVILTCGPDGSWLTDESEQVYTPGIRVDVADTVGAGDAFTAAVVMGMLHEKTLMKIGDRANRLGAYVCTQNGGTPPIPRELLWND